MNERESHNDCLCPGCGLWFNPYRCIERTDAYGRKWHSGCYAQRIAELAEAQRDADKSLRAKRIRRRARLIRKTLRVLAAIF
jgi:hypothetical protein